MQNLKVMRIKSNEAKEFIRQNHYSRGCHNGPSPCYGLFDKEEVIGVLCFATPCSENVRRWLFGEEGKHHVTELHRLFIFDVTEKNTESWFISRCLNLLKKEKPEIKLVVSFSDLTQGHRGTIYAASNFILTGMTKKSVFFRDQEGRLRHPRQCGVNITIEEATRRGWVPEKRESKLRWHFPLGDNKIENRKIRELIRCKISK